MPKQTTHGAECDKLTSPAAPLNDLFEFPPPDFGKQDIALLNLLCALLLKEKCECAKS